MRGLSAIFESATDRVRSVVPISPASGARALGPFLAAGAVGLLGVALWWSLHSFLDGDYPFLFPLLAVIFVSWLGGFPTGAFTLVVTVAAYLALSWPGPESAWPPSQAVGLGLFCLVGLCCALLGEAQRGARHRAARSLQALEAKSSALEVEMARRRALAEAVPQIVWVTRPDGYHEYYNARWYDYTGLTPEESIGWGWSVPLHPEDRARSEARWKHSTDTGEPYEIEYRFRGIDGSYRWFLGRAVPVRGEDGLVRQWFGTCTDIHDQKGKAETLEGLVHRRTLELLRSNEELREEIAGRARALQREALMTAELRRSNEALEQFAYVASHDLQEPLRKIQAFGDRLGRKCRDQVGEQGLEYLDRMLVAAGRMRKLVDDLLAFSRVGTRPQDLAKVDLGQIVEGVLGDLEDALAGADGRVEVGPLPRLTADPTQMRQLFQNLIGNALKFRKPDVAPVITVSAEPRGDRWLLRVADNGIGFEPAHAGRIFELFQRLHGKDAYEGTGLGLAICRKIVQRHGGTIEADGRPGGGATFTIDLPAGPGPALERTSP